MIESGGRERFLGLSRFSKLHSLKEKRAKLRLLEI